MGAPSTQIKYSKVLKKQCFEIMELHTFPPVADALYSAVKNEIINNIRVNHSRYLSLVMRSSNSIFQPFIIPLTVIKIVQKFTLFCRSLMRAQYTEHTEHVAIWVDL